MGDLLISPPRSLLGALRPRVESQPHSITGTFGDVAAELMQRAGKPLEPWQIDGVDLMLSHRADGMWACFEYAEWVARQNGKGGIGEARALTAFFVLGEELVTWTAHEYKTAHEGFRRMKALIRKLGVAVSETVVDFGDYQVKISNGNEESFERLDTGQRIIFIARSKSSGRGFTGDVVIIDEAFAYTLEQAEALGPTMAARPNAQIIYLSSPPLTGDTGEIMFELKDRAEAGGDESLGYRDWGIQGFLDDRAKMDIDDHDLWSQANPALGLGRVTVETIGRLRRMLSAREGRGFAREVLGLWPRRLQGGGAINMAQWARLLDSLSRRTGDLALGVDIAPQRDYAAIGMYGPRDDGLGHWQIVDYRPGTDWLVARMVELKNGLDPVGIGMGRATYVSLKAEMDKVGLHPSENVDEPVRGDLAVLNAAEMTAATGQALDAVRQGTVRHIGQRELDAAAAGAKTRETGDTIVWSRKEAKADTCPLVTVSEARWTYEARAHLIDKVAEPFNIW